MSALIITSVCLLVSPATAVANHYVYISISGENKIAVYQQDPSTGRLTHRHDTHVNGSPGGLVADPGKRFLFASIRAEGRLASFRIDWKTGRLALVGDIPADADPAYVATDQTGRFLLTAYYRAGKVAVHPIGKDGSLDAGTAKWYDTADKAHAIEVDRSNRFVLVPHTGPNAVFQFRFDQRSGLLSLNDVPKINTPPNSGPRHIAFHPNLNRVYSDNEQGSSVTAYLFNSRSGTLAPLQTLSTLPSDFSGNNSCARLQMHPSGNYVYAANRGHDSIAAFTVDKKTGTMRTIGQFPTEKTPRSFSIDASGRFLYAAGQSSGKLALYHIHPETGGLKRIDTIEVGKSPWWVLATSGPK